MQQRCSLPRCPVLTAASINKSSEETQEGRAGVLEFRVVRISNAQTLP